MKSLHRSLIQLLTLVIFFSSTARDSYAAEQNFPLTQAPQVYAKQTGAELWEGDVRSRFVFWGIIAGGARAIGTGVKAGLGAAARVVPRVASAGARAGGQMASRASSIFARTSKLAKSAVQYTTKLAKTANQTIAKTGKLGQLGKSVVKEGLNVAADQAMEQAKGLLSGPAPAPTPAPETPTVTPGSQEAPSSGQEASAGQTSSQDASQTSKSKATAKSASDLLSGPAPKVDSKQSPDSKQTAPNSTSKAEIGMQFAADATGAQGVEELKQVLGTSVDSDKEYRQNIEEADKETRLFFASMLKTDKAMQGDPSFAGFIEVTSLEEANQILLEAAKMEAAAEAQGDKGASQASGVMTEAQKTAAQKKVMKQNLQKPNTLSERERDAAKVEASARKTQAALEQLASKFDARAGQLEKAQLEPDQIPPENLRDDQEVKDILAELDALSAELDTFATAEDEFEDDLYYELDEVYDDILGEVISGEANNVPGEDVSAETSTETQD